MSWMDILLVIILVLSALDGLKRGLIKQLIQLAGVIVAIVLAYKWGPALGQSLTGVLKIEERFSAISAVADIVYNALGYLLVFLGVLVLARLAAVAVGSIARVPVLGAMDKLGGLVVGAVRGALIVLALVWVLNVVPIPSLENAVGSSGIARAFLQVAPRLYQHIKEVINPQLLQGRWPILRPNTLK